MDSLSRFVEILLFFFFNTNGSVLNENSYFCQMNVNNLLIGK